MIRHKRITDYIPYAVFIVVMVFSIFLYESSRLTLDSEIRHTFNLTTLDMAEAVKDRMATYEQVLKGGAGLFQADNGNVTRQMWMTYAKNLNLEKDFPGIQAVGYAEYVSKDMLDAHTEKMRAQGLKNYAVHPVSDKEHYAVVCMMYPENKENMRVMGFDLLSEPVRAAMLYKTEHTGKTGISGKLILKQDITNNPPFGILAALPMFKDGRLTGYISAPFRMNDLMNGIFGSYTKGIAVNIYDEKISQNNLMYSSLCPEQKGKTYIKVIPLKVYGRTWMLEFKSTPVFYAQYDTNKPLLILFSGIVTAALLSMLIFMLQRTRARAYEIAERMSQKFNDSENRYRITFEQAAVGIVMTTLDMKIFKANKRFCEITGYSQKELKQKRFCDLMTEGKGQECLIQVEKLIERRISKYEMERQLRVNTGDNVWVEISASVFFDTNGSPLYTILIVEDITRRKQAEEAIVSLSLRQAAILDNSLVGIIQVKNRVIEWANNTFEEMVGYTNEELTGRSTEVMHVTREDFENFGREIDLPDRLKSEGYVRTQHRMRRRDGSVLWVDITGKAISRDDDSSSIWVFNDITDRINAENELMNLNFNLESRIVEETQKRIEQERLFMQQGRLAAMGEMIGAIAHQWRQPLNIMSIMVQNLNDEFVDKTLTEQKMQEFMDHTLDQITYMSSTIDDFRNFFKKDSDVSNFDPGAQVENVIKLMGSQLSHNKIAIDFSACCSTEVYGSENQFAHVILNLINNAKDAFVARKVKHPKVKITLECDKDRLIVRVKDNAGGISADIADKIFDPYFTTKGPDKGTGIGLYMSKLIVQDNFNGSLTFKNVDDGAEFIINFPSGGSRKKD